MVEKWQSRIFEKNSWFGDIHENVSKLAQNQTLWYLVVWLVGNAVFSETSLRIFLIFCMKLGNCKGRKVTEPDFYFLTIRRSSQCILVWEANWLFATIKTGVNRNYRLSDFACESDARIQRSIKSLSIRKQHKYAILPLELCIDYQKNGIRGSCRITMQNWNLLIWKGHHAIPIANYLF